VSFAVEDAQIKGQCEENEKIETDPQNRAAHGFRIAQFSDAPN